MLHVPVLRAGNTYTSLDQIVLSDIRTGEPVARVSQANRGLIARDMAGAASRKRILASRTAAELITICRKAADLFFNGSLEVDEGQPQTPTDYVRALSATTGMPETMARANMEKNRFVLAEMDRVLAGWTRGLDLSLLDTGYGEEGGRMVAWRPEAEALGAILPANSPGVHSLWMPAFAMKYPLVLKPGRQEPWTPLRVARALMAAGAPPEAFCFYPTDHAGAAEILLRCGRSMLFGDDSTLRAWRDDPGVQLHGPGWSKVILGDDEAPRWEKHLDLMAASITDNGGRSCLNTSSVWCAANGREVALALARRLATFKALPLNHPEARLAAFSVPSIATRINDMIDRLLTTPGAEDLTAKERGSERLVTVDGCAFLLPTVIWCEDAGHPLLSCEFLFPFACVVEKPQDEIVSSIGSTLVATALTNDDSFRSALLGCGTIDRLNLGSIPTSRVSWDQPHEGNLFEHLYRQRALQLASVS